MENTTQAEYADGYLFYERNGVLLAHAFDPDAVTFTADPVPVASNLVSIDGAARSLYSISKNGRMIYMRGSALTTDAGLTWVDSKGNLSEASTEIEVRVP